MKRAAKEVLQRLKRCQPWLSYEKRLRFVEVARNKLFRSAQPSLPALNYFVNRYNLKSLIVLREHVELELMAHAKKLGLTVCHISLKSDRPPDKSEIKKFFEFISDSNNCPSLIHCLQGRDRTGCLCFVYRVEKMEWTADDAWHEMKNLGFLSLPWHHWTQSLIKEWLEQRYDKKFR